MLDTLGKFREHFEINRMKEMNLLKLSYCKATSLQSHEVSLLFTALC